MESMGVVLRNTFLEFSEYVPDRGLGRSRAQSDVSHLLSREWQVAKISMRDVPSLSRMPTKDSPGRSSSITEVPSPRPAAWLDGDGDDDDDDEDEEYDTSLVAGIGGSSLLPARPRGSLTDAAYDLKRTPVQVSPVTHAKHETAKRNSDLGDLTEIMDELDESSFKQDENTRTAIEWHHFQKPSTVPEVLASPLPRAGKKKRRGHRNRGHPDVDQAITDAHRVSCSTGPSPQAPKQAPRSDASVFPAPPSLDATTVVLKNIPPEFDSAMLVQLFDQQGFHSLYDYIYLPVGFQDGVNLGYAFVDLTSHDNALRFVEAFHGFWSWRGKFGEITWAHPCQGLNAHVERYRNSPVMHPSVPDSFKPMVFQDGQRVAFPKPTKPLGPPKGVSRRHVGTMG